MNKRRQNSSRSLDGALRELSGDSMTREHEYHHFQDAGSDALNPVFIAQLASRMFNELPEADSVPKFETAAEAAPALLAGSAPEKPAHAAASDRWHQGKHPDRAGISLLQSESVPETASRVMPQEYYFLGRQHEKEQESLEHHANKLTEQQSYSENGGGSYGLEEALPRDDSSGRPSSGTDFRLTPKSPGGAFPFSERVSGESDEGVCYAEKLYRGLTGELQSPELSRIFHSLKRYAELATGDLSAKSAPWRPHAQGHLPQGETAWPDADLHPGWIDGTAAGTAVTPNPYGTDPGFPVTCSSLHGQNQTPDGRNIFDVLSIRKDFPALHQKIHGRDLVWFDNAATTQKPWSVINAVADFLALDNSNIHRGAHTLAARSTDAYEGTREKVRRFIGASSTSEIIFVRGTTEGINLVAQSWGGRFLQPGDEIVLSILEHHANIVPWQMVARQTGARIRVIPVNDRGEILFEEYTKLLGPRTRFVSLTQASNGLGTILPVREMIRIARRFDVKVLIDGAQSVAHIPVNVQELDADFFVFSGHKIFAPTGIGVVYGKRELLETMPPWQGGGNMIRDVRFEETIYNGLPEKFEAGTPSVADAVGLGAALDYVTRTGLENIGRYEHELTGYATGRLIEIPGLRLIGTAANKVGVLSFVLNSLPNEEVGRLLDREGIAVRTGHHCTQPSLRRFGVEGTVRPSLAFYNTKEEIDRLADVLRSIRRG